MKNYSKLIYAVALILIAATVTVASGNPLMGFAAAGAVATGVQHFTGFSLVDVKEAMLVIALNGIKRKPQTLTIGGAKRLYIISVADLETEFLNYELAKTAGKFTGAIPVKAGKKFTEIEAWYDSTKFDTEMKIGAGFTQNLEYKILGYDEDVVKHSALLYENPVNFIVQGNDDKLYYVGQKYIPMMVEMKGVLPEKGTARKEATYTSKQDGMQIPVFPLAATVTFPVELLDGAEDSDGEDDGE